MATDENHKLKALEDRVSKLEEQLAAIHQGVVGSIGEPGIAETVRATAAQLQKVVQSTDALMQDRWVLRGIAATMGVGGAVIGWLIDHAWSRP